MLVFHIALNIHYLLINHRSFALWMPYLSVTIFSCLFQLRTNLNMQQDNLASACCMNDDVMFSELALNVGLTDVFNI